MRDERTIKLLGPQGLLSLNNVEIRKFMSETKDLSNSTKAVKAEAKKLAQQNASYEVLNDGELEFLLKEWAKRQNNIELDVMVQNLTDMDYRKKIGAFEAGSTQKVSQAISQKISKELRIARQYIKVIQDSIALETELENRNHKRSLWYRILNTFAIYATIILTSMLAYYALGIELALVKFDKKNPKPAYELNCAEDKNIAMLLESLENKELSEQIKKMLVENCQAKREA